MCLAAKGAMKGGVNKAKEKQNNEMAAILDKRMWMCQQTEEIGSRVGLGPNPWNGNNDDDDDKEEEDVIRTEVK